MLNFHLSHKVSGLGDVLTSRGFFKCKKKQVPNNTLTITLGFYFKGNETNILVVAMHHSEIEQWDNVNIDSMDLDHRSCFPLTKIFFSKPFIDDNEVNKQAKEDIQKFIFAK